MIHVGLEPRTVPFVGSETRVVLTGYQMEIRKPATRWRGLKRFEVCPVCGHEARRERRGSSVHNSGMDDRARAREVSRR